MDSDPTELNHHLNPPVDGVVDVVQALDTGAPAVPSVVHYVEGPADQEGPLSPPTPAQRVPGVLQRQGG